MQIALVYWHLMWYPEQDEIGIIWLGEEMRTYFVRIVIPLLLWTLAVLGSLNWNIKVEDDFTNLIALDRSRAFFNIIQTHRQWNAEHGGVYVPIVSGTEPNPYLDIHLRDIETVTGLRLTKVNPAYMTRHVSDLAKQNDGLIFHITSLRPLRPENKADEWEAVALRELEDGLPEKIVETELNGQPYFRYMAPLKVSEPCLQCHANQGYKLGDIRGGISISTPASSLLSSQREHKIGILEFHILVLAAGILMIFFFQKRAISQERALRQSLSEKDVLLREIHHRVKNNLSVIQGLLALQAMTSDDKDLQWALHDSQSRVRAMAMIHERLYKTTDLKSIGTAEYVSSLVRELVNTYLADPGSVELSIDIGEDVALDVSTLIPCGLIINELVTNSLKYAFAEGQKGRLSIVLNRTSGQRHRLEIRDSGVGLPEKFNMEAASGIGLKIVTALVNQMDGNLEARSDGGAVFSIEFSDTVAQ